MTDTANTPETGLDGQGETAPNDDISTEAFDRAPAPDDEADDPEASASGEEEGEGDAADKDKPAEDDGEEVEYEGQKYKVPAALKDALLRQADYSRKTQDLAKERQTLAEERSTWESQREESRAALPKEHAQVAVLEHRLADIDRELDPNGKGLGAVDWEAYRAEVQNLPSDDPDRLKYARLRDAYMALRDSRIDLGDKFEAARKDLQTKEEARLSEQQEKAQASLRQAQQETGRVLAAEVQGWNAEAAAKVIEFAGTHLGIKPEEMAEAIDPRLWKALHELRLTRDENAALKKAQKQQQTAANHDKAQQAKPADKPNGGGAQARDPSSPRGDGLSMDEWMRRRTAQVAKKRA